MYFQGQNGQILKTFCDYNAQNLEKFEKNQLPFPVFIEKLAKKGQILKTFCDYNAQNLEKLRNLEKKKLTSGEKSTSGSGRDNYQGLLAFQRSKNQTSVSP